MGKFKVGDKVKIIKLISPNSDGSDARRDCYLKSGTIIRDWGESYRYRLDTIDRHLFKDEELELVEEPTLKSTELKIDSNKITLTVDKIQNVIKKEGNKMIESLNLIDLYANKHKESIEEETKEKVEELRKNCDVINKYNELVEQFKKDCDELYLSQFTEEEKNEILVNQDIIDDIDMQLRKDGCREFGYYTNNNFRTDEYYDAMNERNKKITEIEDLVKTVKAHVGIAKTKEEVEEILTRYGIIKKGKLVTK